MYQTETDWKAERTRRLLYVLFGVSMTVSVAICSVILFLVLSGEQGRRLVGRDGTFAVGEVATIPVERLELSKILPNSPIWSEDIIFVIKQRDRSYQAFLSLDPGTGCKLNWREAEHHFVDDCSQTSYTITGRNATDIASLETQPNHMIELPVQIEGEEVYVVDRILRRNRQ